MELVSLWVASRVGRAPGRLSNPCCRQSPQGADTQLLIRVQAVSSRRKKPFPYLCSAGRMSSCPVGMSPNSHTCAVRSRHPGGEVWRGGDGMGRRHHTCSRGQGNNGDRRHRQERGHDYQRPAQGLHVHRQPWGGGGTRRHVRRRLCQPHSPTYTTASH